MCCLLSCRIGTYALVGMLLVLHMKLHALAAFELTSVGAVLIAAHCASRWTSVPLLYFCRYIQVCLHLGTTVFPAVAQPLSQSSHTFADARKPCGRLLPLHRCDRLTACSWCVLRCRVFNIGTWCRLCMWVCMWVCMWLCLYEIHAVHVGVVSLTGMHGKLHQHCAPNSIAFLLTAG
jgi:hypothetical protein